MPPDAIGTPDAVLNPKKKIFETVQVGLFITHSNHTDRAMWTSTTNPQPDLVTSDALVATYKGDPFTVEVGPASLLLLCVIVLSMLRTSAQITFLTRTCIHT